MDPPLRLLELVLHVLRYVESSVEIFIEPPARGSVEVLIELPRGTFELRPTEVRDLVLPVGGLEDPLEHPGSLGESVVGRRRSVVPDFLEDSPWEGWTSSSPSVEELLVVWFFVSPGGEVLLGPDDASISLWT